VSLEKGRLSLARIRRPKSLVRNLETFRGRNSTRMPSGGGFAATPLRAPIATRLGPCSRSRRSSTRSRSERSRTRRGYRSRPARASAPGAFCIRGLEALVASSGRGTWPITARSSFANVTQYYVDVRQRRQRYVRRQVRRRYELQRAVSDLNFSLPSRRAAACVYAVAASLERPEYLKSGRPNNLTHSSHQLFACNFTHSPTISGTSSARSRYPKRLKSGRSRTCARN